jgi:hypothetical protein
MALHKPAASNSAALAEQVGSSAATALWPLVMEMVVEPRYADGSSRVTASLLIFAEDGLFKVCLNDRDCMRSAWATGRTPEAALDALDAALRSDRVEWRTSRPGGGKKGR